MAAVVSSGKSENAGVGDCYNVRFGPHVGGCGPLIDGCGPLWRNMAPVGGHGPRDY